MRQRAAAAAAQPAADALAGSQPPGVTASRAPEAAAQPETLAASGPAEMFFLLVVAMGLATFALAVVFKVLRARRLAPLEDPDSAWRRYRKDRQRPRPEAADEFALPARSRPPAAPELRPVSTWIELFAAGRKELAPALRAIGEWRRREAA